MQERTIGYWHNEFEAKDKPMPIANSANDDEIIRMIAQYKTLVKNSTERFCKGSSTCRICGKSNGSSEFVHIKKNVRTLIPIGLMHYITDHRVLVKELLLE